MDSTTEFATLVRVASRELPRYQTLHSTTFPGHEWFVSEIEAHNHLGAFIRRISFLERFSNGQIDGASAAEQFERESARTNCHVTRFVLFDGLDIPVPEAAIPDTQETLLKLTLEHVEELQKQSATDIPSDLGRFVGVVALTSHFTADNPPWGPGRYEWTPPRRRAISAALPWLDYLNLWDSGKLRVLGMLEKCDSLLVDHAVRGVGVEEPNWEPRYVYDEERSVEEWAYDELVRTVEINDVEALLRHLQRCERGRRASAQRTDHINIALRYFRRVAENYRLVRDDYAPDVDVTEDIVIDTCTALETMLLGPDERDSGNKGKGKAVEKRVGLLITDSAKARKMRDAVEDIYQLRNAILHGDEERPALTESAMSCEPVLRNALAGFLAVDGNLEPIIQAMTDRARAEGLRDRLKASGL